MADGWRMDGGWMADGWQMAVNCWVLLHSWSLGSSFYSAIKLQEPPNYKSLTMSVAPDSISIC